MSFIDSAEEVLDRAEASLRSLITDALKAKSYREITAIAALAESVAAIGGTDRSGESTVASAPAESTPTRAGAEPSWMRPKGT